MDHPDRNRCIARDRDLPQRTRWYCCEFEDRDIPGGRCPGGNERPRGRDFP